MDRALIILAVFFSIFVPAISRSGEVDEKAAFILDNNVNWHVRVKLIDEISPVGSPKVLDTLAAVYYDSLLNFGCPSLLYHVIDGLRYFHGNGKAIEIVREALNDREPLIRMISIEVLGAIGSEEDIKYLKPFLTSKHSYESNKAQSAIEGITKSSVFTLH